ADTVFGQDPVGVELRGAYGGVAFLTALRGYGQHGVADSQQCATVVEDMHVLTHDGAYPLDEHRGGVQQLGPTQWFPQRDVGLVQLGDHAAQYGFGLSDAHVRGGTVPSRPRASAESEQGGGSL